MLTRAGVDQLAAYATALGATLPPEGVHVNDQIIQLLAGIITASGGTAPTTGAFNDRVNAMLTELTSVGAGSGYRQVSTWEQGASLQDLGGMLVGGTNAIASGVITAVTGPAYALNLQGYQQPQAVATQLLSVQEPTFGVSGPGNSIDVVAVIQSLPATTAKVGLFVGIVDDTAPNQVTWNGACGHLFPNSSTTWNGGVLAPTGLQTNVSQGSTQIDRVWCRITINPTTREATVLASCRAVGGAWKTMTSYTGVACTFGADLTKLRVVAGIEKIAVTLGQPTVQFSVYTRTVKAAAVFP